MINIAIQSFLRPALTAVPHCHDYAVFKDTLERIERLLIDSSVERQAIESFRLRRSKHLPNHRI